MAKKTETRPATGHINPFGLRMQPDLRAKLEDAANTAGRSLNAEIVSRLEDSFQPVSTRSRDDLAQIVEGVLVSIASQGFIKVTEEGLAAAEKMREMDAKASKTANKAKTK